MVKKMSDYVLSISNLPMKSQRDMLVEEFAKWKGDNEQVDDICIIGIKI